MALVVFNVHNLRIQNSSITNSLNTFSSCLNLKGSNLNLQIQEPKFKVPNLEQTRITLLWSHDTDAGGLLAYSLQLSQRINDNDTNNNASENILTLLLVICVVCLCDISNKQDLTHIYRIYSTLYLLNITNNSLVV